MTTDLFLQIKSKVGKTTYRKVLPLVSLSFRDNTLTDFTRLEVRPLGKSPKE